jgi:bifunctional non-homologous end joining protein LigD
MALEEYKRKRDFRKTAEPPPGKPVSHEGFSYLIQKHDATRLHYDIRLELDGILLSWAVTKGPSLNPSDKRLAVRTEDHPLSYGTFEGTIPKGQYGGGTVMLWDRGSWEPKGDAHAGLKKGHLAFTLHGERLKGGWDLIRMRSDQKKENWLLTKEKDHEALSNGPAGKFEKIALYAMNHPRRRPGQQCGRRCELRHSQLITTRESRHLRPRQQWKCRRDPGTSACLGN